MSANNHRASVYYSLNQLLNDMCSHDEDEWFKKRRAKIIRYWTKVWKNHSLRNGNKPLIMKCSICSGKERLNEIKCGAFKISTRRDKDYKNEEKENY